MSLKKISKPAIIFISFVFVILLAIFNNYISIHRSLIIFYLVPVYLVVWYSGPIAGIFIALCSIVSWFLKDVAAIKDLYFHPFFFYFNMMARASFLFAIIYILTRLKSALVEIQKSEAWFSTTLNSIGDAVIATDIKGNIIFSNPVALKLTGWDKIESIGKSLEEIFNIVDEKTGKKAENPVDRVIRQGVVVGLANHTILIRKDGERLPIDDSAAPIKNENGGLIGVVLIFRDVSEQRRVRTALESSEESYRSIFESLNDGVIIRDIDTYDIISVNNKACEMFCYQKWEMPGLKVGDLSTNSSEYPVEKLKEFFNKAVNAESQLFEWLAKDKFGREFWVEINIKRAVIEGQSRILYVVRDITERKKAAEERDDFMNMVSHELRTPLSAIKESILIIREGKIGAINKKQQEMLNIGKNNIDRLTRLINRVLDFQKIDAGRMEFKFEENNINKIVKEVYNSMTPLAYKKGLKLNLILDDKLPLIKFDKDKVVGALTNIVSNAVKFTEKGDIAITTRPRDNFIQVSVKDAGCGIKEDDMPKLFKRFAQLKRKPGGTGLGLAISKEIIERHGGSIWVESELGRGSTFYFTLPVEKWRK